MKKPDTKAKQVGKAAWSYLEEKGTLPTARDLLNAMGGGSLRDINQGLRQWREELADWVHHHRHRPDLPDEVWSSMSQMWDQALTQARKALSQEYEALRKQIQEASEAAQQTAREAEKREWPSRRSASAARSNWNKLGRTRRSSISD